MIAFPLLLVTPAEEAGIKVPPDIENFDKNLYPHFEVYLSFQLGRSMPWPTAQWDNAKTIAAIPEDEIRSVTINDLLRKGCV